MNKNYITIAVIFVGLIVAGFILVRVFGSIDTVLENIGLKQSEQDKAIEQGQKIALKQDYFSPTYFKTIPIGYKKVYLKTKYTSALEATAKLIYDSVGVFSDNPKQLQAAFSEYKNKVQVSQLAEKFAQKYSISLYGFLTTKVLPQSFISSIFMSDSEKIFADVITRLNNLPTGFYEDKTFLKPIK